MNRTSSVAVTGMRLPAWTVFARLGWLLLSLVILWLLVAGAPGRLAALSAEFAVFETLLGVSPGLPAALFVGLELLAVLFHVVVAAFLVWRRPGDPMALFVATALTANGALVPLNLMYGGQEALGAADFSLDMVVFVGLVSSIGLLYLFPDGRFAPRWTRYLWLGWVLLLVPEFFLQGVPFSLRRWPAGAQLALLLLFSGAGIGAQLQRYRHYSTPVMRQQTKWGILGLTAAVLGPLSYFLPFVIIPAVTEATPNMLVQRMGATFFTLSSAWALGAALLMHLLPFLFPLSFAVAILRYRLWDVDVIIRKTLMYSTLTAVLLVVYLGSVVLMQAVFGRLFGAESGPAIVVSTLIIAALFAPLRRRVQAGIDRRFYRQKVDAQQALAGFARAARDEVDLDALLANVAGVVQETLKPESVSVWLVRSEGGGRSPELTE